MERLLLLWDELDEFVGLGWHFAAGLSHTLAWRLRRRPEAPRDLAADQA
jgi:hypothetical protein